MCGHSTCALQCHVGKVTSITVVADLCEVERSIATKTAFIYFLVKQWRQILNVEDLQMIIKN